MKLKALYVLAASAVVILAAPQAAAQSGSDGWKFTIAPYLVAAGLDGSLTVADFEADVDVPFDDVISDLDVAFMGHFDMQNERWLISSDLIFVDLEDSEVVAQGTGTASVEETLWEVAGGYRISPVVTFLVGARWVDLSCELQYSGPAVQGSVDTSKSWIAHSWVPTSLRLLPAAGGSAYTVTSAGSASARSWPGRPMPTSAGRFRTGLRSSSAIAPSTSTTRRAAGSSTSTTTC